MPNNINWTSHAIAAFIKLKSKLVNIRILKPPEVEKGFVLRTDASGNGLGAVLLQEQDGILLPVSYASKKLLPRQQRYSVIDLCLTIVWAFDHFKTYLFARPFVLQTDHKALKYWTMQLIQMIVPYHIVFQDIPGKENVGADFLSRI